MNKKIISFAAIVLIVFNSLLAQQLGNDFHLEIIEDDFIGVYLPVEYIAILEATKNHSLAFQHNKKRPYHDVLIVNKNTIYSNAKWSDGYAIKASEGNLYQFVRVGTNRIIIDNNGYSYRKIGDYPPEAYNTARTFVKNIIFESLLEQNIGVFIHENTVVLPFLNFFTGGGTFAGFLPEKFMEEGSSLILGSRGNTEFYSTIYMFTNGINYSFYFEKDRSGQLSPFSFKEDFPFFQFNLNTDKEILIAASGLGEDVNSELLLYLDGLTHNERRKIINAMFALNGYSFVTDEWRNYFSQFSWYKPIKGISNSRSVLTPRQQRLLDYLNK